MGTGVGVDGLWVGDVQVATYVVDPALDIRLSPRPYFHPVRTLGGVVVTDALCFDHPWHMGASLTMADVNGVNFWGGRTFVRDVGYTWLRDHGRIRHDAWLLSEDGFGERLLWCDESGRPVVAEERFATAVAVEFGWELRLSYVLSAVREEVLTLGSPATHGRTGKAGYGGFFWRAPEGSATAFTADGDDPNGSAAAWVALTGDGAYTLVFRGIQDDDRWFVRTEEYAGVCAALAFDHELKITPGNTLTRGITVLVADGELTAEQISHSRPG